mmetsp:Transcript_13233/g.33227  ORF Transcript_13233/g.33227 Transcript_13233/m.33227 type:complete len:90 (-) Transcript_13233:50-319(-)|eukprot:CAMPEP_0198234894 /NCGR_PEP_ID=MMETSP1446-20131203/770_1 /TAXON_ID=1461542 ORGANISM="Unidentified sp, Strain CCMP2111" /NCGR_SAMPLE_ID=MMETSP1446 /ASSEMBLY_ACC=CAM_ASM_001112 /LENGTH=89 /DNA_ID=CAMNT_0043915745 /DNA_START=158 /DNA_END=427 /DNA_ORIENTATION=-
MLFCFTDVVDSLIERPSETTNKIENLRTLILNFGYLLNLVRPYQARAGAEQRMQKDCDVAGDIGKDFSDSLKSSLAQITKTLDDVTYSL